MYVSFSYLIFFVSLIMYSFASPRENKCFCISVKELSLLCTLSFLSPFDTAWHQVIYCILCIFAYKMYKIKMHTYLHIWFVYYIRKAILLGHRKFILYHLIRHNITYFYQKTIYLYRYVAYLIFVAICSSFYVEGNFASNTFIAT